jgi:hypothetical protein
VDDLLRDTILKVGIATVNDGNRSIEYGSLSFNIFLGIRVEEKAKSVEKLQSHIYDGLSTIDHHHPQNISFLLPCHDDIVVRTVLHICYFLDTHVGLPSFS